MAEEQVMSQVLVLDGNREKLAKKLSDGLIRKTEKPFVDVFISLCQDYGIADRATLRDINSKEEILLLEEMILKRANWTYSLIKFLFTPFLMLIPIFGWSVLFDIWGKDRNTSYSIYYCRNRNKLKKFLGKDFFPFETLKQELQKS